MCSGSVIYTIDFIQVLFCIFVQILNLLIVGHCRLENLLHLGRHRFLRRLGHFHLNLGLNLGQFLLNFFLYTALVVFTF